MYSINAYGRMITDTVRMNAYVEALRRAIRPGAVVLDIGTGTGFFAMLAMQLGARHVYAVEPSDAVGLAREMAAANGYADSIDFFQGLSTELQFPELADVIVSDLRGVLPLFQQHIPSIAHARKRLLAPGGTMIPQRDRLFLACVEDDSLHRQNASPWLDRPYGIDMSAGARLMANQWTREEIGVDKLLSEPALFGELDYGVIEEPDFRGQASVTVARDGTAHGICAWFDATLADGVGFSNAPGQPGAIYGKAFFPWPQPVAVRAGDRLAVDIRATLIGEDYVWRWDSQLTDPSNPQHAKASFRQSSFFGEPFSPEKLRRKSAAHVPALAEDGRIDRLVLELMAKRVPLGDIARRLAADHPLRFSNWQEALTRVGDLSAKYSRG